MILRRNNAKALTDKGLGMTPRQLVQFISKIGPRPLDGDCWQWLGGCDGKGYGKVQINKRKLMAHRVSYVLFNGPIEAKMEIDHTCCDRGCVNPAHLEKVTKTENLNRHLDRVATKGKGANDDCPF